MKVFCSSHRKIAGMQPDVNSQIVFLEELLLAEGAGEGSFAVVNSLWEQKTFKSHISNNF
jgi:hypothetical protein